MSEVIAIKISSNAAQIVRELHAFPPAMAQGIARALDLQNELTIADIQAKKLSRRGPETLGVITNRFRSSIRRTEAVVLGNTVDSAIGTNVRYAGAHEFGFSGQVTVREHRARHHALDVFNVRGALVRGWQLPGVGSGRRQTRVAEGFVTVRRHTMQMNIKARAPIGSTIRERAPEYTQAVSAAIVAAWEKPSP